MTVHAVVSDLHCGSTVGLHPDSETPNDDGGGYLPSAAQRWMWSHWQAYWARVKQLSKRDALYLWINGDLCDGDHHGTSQIVSRHPGTQIDIAMRAFDYVWSQVKPAGVIIVRGTEAHVGKSGAAEEGFARALADRGIPIIGDTTHKTKSHWMFKGEFDGVLIDAKHHGRMGQRVWTKASVANNLAATIFYEHAALHERWPDLSLRSHYHKYVDTGDNQPVRLIQTPSWQLATAFIHKVAADSIADIGGIIVTTKDGHADIEKHIIHPAPSPVWRPKA